MALAVATCFHSTTASLHMAKICTPQCDDGYVPKVNGVSGYTATLSCLAKVLTPSTFQCVLAWQRRRWRIFVLFVGEVDQTCQATSRLPKLCQFLLHPGQSLFLQGAIGGVIVGRATHPWRVFLMNTVYCIEIYYKNSWKHDVTMIFYFGRLGKPASYQHTARPVNCLS